MKYFTLRNLATLSLALLLAVSPVFADTQGNTNIGSAGTRAMDQVVRGIDVTIPAGTWAAGVTITAYLTNPTGTEEFSCAIYSLAGAVNNAARLVESTGRSDITSANWYTFSGGGLATYTPTGGTSIHIACASYTNADALINYDDGAGRNQSIDGTTPINMTVEPMNTDARTYSIYITYTAASSGGLLLRRRRAANDDHFLTPVWEREPSRPLMAANF